MRVLATKTLSERSLAYARTLGFDVTCVDFITITKVDYTFPDSVFDALVFTSENAVKYVAENLEKMAMLRNARQPFVFSLSGKTNEALQKHNIQADFTADNADLLAEKLLASGVKNILHICGNLALDTLKKAAANNAISYEKLIVYNTEKTPQKLDISGFFAVFFFSPSGVESFFSVNEMPQNAVCVSIGKTTEKALKSKTQNQILIADKPSAEAMFDVLKQHFVI